MYPTLISKGVKQRVRQFSDSLAVWGLNGDYLVVWSSNGLWCRVTVYKTENLAARRVKFENREDFGVASASVTVETIQASEQNGKIQVLITNFDLSGGALLFLWDLETNAVLREMNMSVPVSPSRANSQEKTGDDGGVSVFAANEL